MVARTLGTASKKKFVGAQVQLTEVTVSKTFVRNLFDQYSQEENRLTNALLQIFRRNPQIVRKFLRSARVALPPKDADLSLSCLYLPGEMPPLSANEDDLMRRGYPDAWIYAQDFSWVVAIESKLTVPLTTDQLYRHIAMAHRMGSRRTQVLVITADESMPPSVVTMRGHHVLWENWAGVFGFFSDHGKSWFEREFLDYVRIAEARLMAKGYDGPPLTKFTGIPFSDNHPYNINEAKVLLRALTGELRRKLSRSNILRINPNIRRPAIGSTSDVVWEVFGLAAASPNEVFTKHPHLTVVIGPHETVIHITVPNNADRSYWDRIATVSEQDLFSVLAAVTARVRPMRRFLKKGVWEPQLTIDVHQRHFYARRRPFSDGRLTFRLDTLLPKDRRIDSGVRTVPKWLTALHTILSQSSKANFELTLKVTYALEAGSVAGRSELVNEMRRAAEALAPFATFILPVRKRGRLTKPLGT
jgi:hypothetical protein